MPWPQKLAELLADRNLSEVRKRLGFSKNRLYTILREENCPNAVDAVRICRYLGVTVEDVFGEDAGAAVRSASPAQIVPPRKRAAWQAFALARGRYRGRQSLKLLGPAERIEPEDYRGTAGWVPVLAPIAAGEPREAHDQGYPVGAAECYIRFAADDPAAFALTVDGDSMMPDFRHGDVVVASPKLGQSRESLRDGMIAVAVFGTDRVATLKRVRFGEVRGRDADPLDYVLEPTNPHFPPMRLRRVEIAAIWPVVGLISKEV